MASIRVANVRGCGLQPGWVCVDRRTALGNPFKHDTREQNIERYRRWLWAQIKRGQGPAFRMFEHLVAQARDGDLVLACWCAPKPCHADVIKRAIEWRLGQ